MAALPWLLPRARAVLTSDPAQVRRSGLEKVRLHDGKLNNAMIISAAAAVGRVWRGGAKVASTKNKAIDYVLLNAIDRPFRDGRSRTHRDAPVRGGDAPLRIALAQP